ncbi:MAG: hypothetical protein UT33_C0006G0080 [Candidatus Peregrinibacteria bacterium GW2011_GWC2_39_14]|nr:MAG: hypothetical protein UT33_C0006G0080 [Candidatus Peregrinibacteria bacterium GW2011_GWC2_39_14]
MSYKNPETRKRCQAKSFRERKAKARCEIIEMLGNKCSKCGFEDERALCLDHVNGGGKKEQKKFGGSYIMQILKRIKLGSEEYQLLCCNCNQIKKIDNKEDTSRKYI